MSFVNVKEYNKLKAKVGELEARIQALEGFGAAVVEEAPESEPEPEIPTIEEAVSEPTLHNLLDDKTADLLVENKYPDVAAVSAASDEELVSISGIGQATVDRIRKALEA